jgi:hypothetical protein
VEEKIRIVLEGLKGEASIAEICRREGINPNQCCPKKNILDSGNLLVIKGLRGETNEIDLNFESIIYPPILGFHSEKGTVNEPGQNDLFPDHGISPGA